jgi:hypothetical protein
MQKSTVSGLHGTGVTVGAGVADGGMDVNIGEGAASVGLATSVTVGAGVQAAQAAMRKRRLISKCFIIFSFGVNQLAGWKEHKLPILPLSRPACWSWEVNSQFKSYNMQYG